MEQQSENLVLKIVSFNCHGFKSSLSDIRSLCNSYDIIFLQELWLYKTELHLLHKVHPDFEGIAVSSMKENNGLTHGRPYGGIGILLNKRLRKYCDFQTYDDSRLIALEFISESDKLLFVNVYMPYQCDDNYDLFVEYLGKLTAILESAHSSKVCFVGDFNANVNTRFETELIEMCTQN